MRCFMHYAEEGVVRGLIKHWIDVAPLVMACVRCAPVNGQRALLMITHEPDWTHI